MISTFWFVVIRRLNCRMGNIDNDHAKDKEQNAQPLSVAE
jgi:hypothetical protein